MKQIEAIFSPRDYQSKIMREFFIEGKKRMLLVQHRRAGKDLLCFNMMWMKAIQKPGLYLYLLPIISQSSSVIWRGRGKDGISILDNIPPQIISKVNHSTQSITLTNGSIIRVTGSDNYESTIIGTNALGVVFSEFQSANPMAWKLLSPILSENDGFAIFQGTPRGHNFFYDLYEQNKDNPEWHTSILTVDDTKREDGSPVITKEAIQAEIDAGMPIGISKQEYYCSFESEIAGAYYHEEMAKAKEDGRICSFEIEPNLPVHTSWDIGVRDQTVIILWQVHNDGSKRAIHIIEQSGKDVAWFAWQLHKVKEKMGIKRWGTHYLPHDVKVREWGGGRTRIEQLQQAGINPRVVSMVKVSERIQCSRVMLDKVWFHEKNCKQLIRAMLEYHSTFDEKLGVKSLQPVHNWASHACDAFSYFAVGYLEINDAEAYRNQRKYASFQP